MLLAVLAGAATGARGAGEVTAVETVDVPATPSGYTIGDTAFRWGEGTDQVLEAFVTAGERGRAVRDRQRGAVRREPLVEGHTDSVGPAAYDEGLGLRRARATRDYLIALGIAAERLRVESFGERRPGDDNATPEGRARNRRVELREL